MVNLHPRLYRKRLYILYVQCMHTSRLGFSPPHSIARSEDPTDLHIIIQRYITLSAQNATYRNCRRAERRLANMLVLVLACLVL